MKLQQILALLLLSHPLENLCPTLAKKKKNIIERVYPDRVDVFCVQSRAQPLPVSFLEGERERTLATRLDVREVTPCALMSDCVVSRAEFKYRLISS